MPVRVYVPRLQSSVFIGRNQFLQKLIPSLTEKLRIRSLHSYTPAALHSQTLLLSKKPNQSGVLSAVAPNQLAIPQQTSPQSRTMSTQPHQDPDPAIQEILTFWFNLSMIDWFKDSSKHDSTITQKFGPLVEKARTTNQLDSTWSSTPSGSLALILLLDQFTRNIYRPGVHSTPGLSWSGDAKALTIASRSIAQGFDRQIQVENATHRDLGFSHRSFFYLPFMHAEDMSSQIACVALFEVMKRECEIAKMQRDLKGETEETEQEAKVREMAGFSLGFAIKHLNCIAAVGRFPARNEPLGREHRAVDEEWLESHPEGF